MSSTVPATPDSERGWYERVFVSLGPGGPGRPQMSSASSGTGYLTIAAWLQVMGEKEGWAFMDKLHDNIAVYTHSGSAPCVQAAKGERAIGIGFDMRGAKEKTRGTEYATKMAQEKGAQRTASGLIYIEQTAGSGDQPTASDTVKVHYEGKLTDGSVFDSSIQRGQPVEHSDRGAGHHPATGCRHRLTRTARDALA